VKNGKALKKSPTSGADKGEAKETFLDTAVGKINEMLPVPIEREFRIVFSLLLLHSLIKIVHEIYRARGKSVYLLELHVLTTINMFTKVCFLWGFFSGSWSSGSHRHPNFQFISFLCDSN
jgi:hypothetical protein